MAYKHRRQDGRIVVCRGLIGRELKETGEKLLLHIDHHGNVIALTLGDVVFEAVK